jgi:hypothetical protein
MISYICKTQEEVFYAIRKYDLRYPNYGSLTFILYTLKKFGRVYLNKESDGMLNHTFCNGLCEECENCCETKTKTININNTIREEKLKIILE